MNSIVRRSSTTVILSERQVLIVILSERSESKDLRLFFEGKESKLI